MARATINDVLVAINGLVGRIDKIEARLDNLEQPKPTTKKKNGKGNNKVVEQKPTTRREAIKQWAESKYTEEERQAYGLQKKAEREKQKKAYEKTVKFFKGKKVPHSEFMKKYNEFLAK